MVKTIEFDSDTIGTGEYSLPVVVEFSVYCKDSSGCDWEWEIESVKTNGVEIYKTLSLEQVSEIESMIENTDVDSIEAYSEYSQGLIDHIYDNMREGL